MSLVTCSVGSLRNSSHDQLRGLSISPSMTKLHSACGMRGVGPADNTGKSLTRYCPGGRRELLAVSRRLPRNPRDMNDIVGCPPYLPAATACQTEAYPRPVRAVRRTRAPRRFR